MRLVVVYMSCGIYLRTSIKRNSVNIFNGLLIIYDLVKHGTLKTWFESLNWQFPDKWMKLCFTKS